MMHTPTAHSHCWTNPEIADQLERVAELLESQDANPFRVRAYRQAAAALRWRTDPIVDLLETEGEEGLRRLPGIGVGLSRAIEQLVLTGSIPLLEQLRGEDGVERNLATVPGIGPTLAARIHEQLGIETLTELEVAAHDGRLDRLEGFGPQRVRAVRESLAGRFRRPAPLARPHAALQSPTVHDLLDIDREYRTKAGDGTLRHIAPRRFNPKGEAWLPVLHTTRGVAHYTALFSNTARAHELGTTHDWVVIYRDDHEGSGQWTVVTERSGQLTGRRVVRGRESECMAYYASLS
jgi:hypothetical protein